jgi:cysteine desulfurase
VSEAAIYLDHNATAPLLPEVREAMGRALAEAWANPSSIHAAGRRARAAVEDARAQVAALIGALSDEVVFTSGGTEGNHLAIRGLASGSGPLVSSPLEHPSVLGALEAAAPGAGVRWLPVAPDGRLSPVDLKSALAGPAALVSLALVNHELGNLYPIPELAGRSRAAGVPFHCDAVQALGRIPVDVTTLGADALTLSAHKIGGPKGVGAVWLRSGQPARPLLAGGHQERERRAGTENVAGIIGFGVACRLAAQGLADRAQQLAHLRDRLERRLLDIPGARRHGDPDARAPGVTNVGFEGAAGQLVAIGLDLDGVAVSTGAACSSGTVAPSPVLRALGLSPARAREAVRFSLGPGNTEAEIDRAAALVELVVARVRAAA